MNSRWGIVIFLLMAACTSSVKAPEPVEGPSKELTTIDSLMWQRPDSALTLLLPYFDTACRDGVHTVSTAYDWHYANLLLAELLYKNDSAQTNRAELLKAVDYFDSLLLADACNASLRGFCRRDTPRVSANRRHPTAFLAARAHYINGVGFYEHDSVVSACAEYLKTLEQMESYFDDKVLVGHKARFMALTYGRLGEMFNEQLLVEPAITCYKQALLYCKREPTSIYGIPVLLYNLGIQFDIANQKDSAAFYYDKALANLPDYDNIHYRDIMMNKSIFAFYNLDISSDSIIKVLKHIISLSADEDERITRLLTLGNILFEAKQYDSSRICLETVFEQQENITSKIMAAEDLSSIYQINEDSINAQKYASFLASFTMAEIVKKKDVSRIDELFNNYLVQKQEKKAEINREDAIKKNIKIIIPNALIIVLVIIISAKLRSKKLLRKQQEEADRILGKTEQQHKEELKRRQDEAERTLEDKEKHHQQEIEAKEAQARKELEERDKQHAKDLEAERHIHHMKQAAISGRLKRKNQEVRELKDQIKQLDDLAAKTEVAASFDEEPVCRLIMDRVNDGQFKSKIDCELYKSYALDKQQLLDLRLAADRHFGQFTIRLKKAYPNLTNSDLDYCCLYLLGLTNADIAALMQRAYNTVVERDNKIEKILGSEKPLPIILMDIALNNSSI